MNDISKGYFYAILALLSGGAFYLTSKFTTIKFWDTTDSINMAFWWFLWAFLISTPFFIAKKKSREKITLVANENIFVIIGISFITAIAIWLYWYVLWLADVWTIALLSQSNVMFSLLLSLIFLWERINRKEMSYLLIVLVWFIMLSINDAELSLAAFWIILLVRFLYAVQSFIVKRYWKNIDWFVFWYLRTGLIVFFFWIYGFVFDKISFISLELCFFASIAIIFGSIFSKSCFFHAHKYLEVWRLNIFMLFQAVVTLIGSVIFFQEGLPLNKVIWTILIIWWLYFFTKYQLVKKEKILHK